MPGLGHHGLEEGLWDPMVPDVEEPVLLDRLPELIRQLHRVTAVEIDEGGLCRGQDSPWAGPGLGT